MIKKNTFVFACFLEIVLLASLCAFLVIQVQRNSSLRSQLVEKKEALEEAQKASRKMKQLEKQRAELDQTAATLTERVAEEEHKPLSLIRELTQLAGELGLREVRFAVQDKSFLEQPAFELPKGLVPLFLQMDFRGEYAQVLLLLRRIRELKRIVSVETVSIQRKEELLPLQAVSLNLSTFSFPKTASK